MHLFTKIHLIYPKWDYVSLCFGADYVVQPRVFNLCDLISVVDLYSNPGLRGTLYGRLSPICLIQIAQSQLFMWGVVTSEIKSCPMDTYVCIAASRAVD